MGLLHGYQRRGIAFGVKKGGRVLLADEMGLGKTVQVDMGTGSIEWDVVGMGSSVSTILFSK